MSEEIEEMLFKLKRQNTFEDIGYFKTALSNEDVDLLLNYINQLQQENQQLKNKINMAVEYIEEEVYGIKYGNFVKPCGYENTNCDDECEKLVQILKGENND